MSIFELTFAWFFGGNVGECKHLTNKCFLTSTPPVDVAVVVHWPEWPCRFQVTSSVAVIVHWFEIGRSLRLREAYSWHSKNALRKSNESNKFIKRCFIRNIVCIASLPITTNKQLVHNPNILWKKKSVADPPP